MKVEYYVTDATTGIPVWAEIRKATQFDYKKTVEEQWQTSWLSDFIQTDSLDCGNRRISWTWCIQGYAGRRFGIC